MKNRMKNRLSLVLLLASGCANSDFEDSVDVENAVASADYFTGTESAYESDAEFDAANDSTPLAFRADIAAMNALWSNTHGAPAMRTIQDAFRVTVNLGPNAQIRANSHLFGGGATPTVNVIPWDDGDVIDTAADHWIIRDRAQTYANGQATNLRGDEALARYFHPGDIGFAIKHHRPEHRLLDLAAAGEAGASELKEAMKLFDTHIELVVGVRRMGDHDHNPATPDQMVDGVITLNNPQDYEIGRFGTADYPMIFVEPTYPSYLRNKRVTGSDQLLVDAFEANIRTMMLGFNAVSNFPSDYNGGDPLAVHNAAALRRASAMMVKAIAGDAAAVAYFREPGNLVYCAELGFISASAGMQFPLNQQTFVAGGMVTAAEWTAFVEQIRKHNAGEPSTFDSMNDNGLAYLVQATTAPTTLGPAWSYARGQAAQVAASELLAFQPLTMADIVQEFMRVHIPRNVLGENQGIATAQAALLSALKPGLLESMGMDTVPESDPRRQAVDALFGDLVRVVGTSHAQTGRSREGNYAAFQTALTPLMVRARQMTGPRGDPSGTGLFVPPSLFHVVTQGRQNALLGLRYVGHGLHYSVVNRTR